MFAALPYPEYRKQLGGACATRKPSLKHNHRFYLSNSTWRRSASPGVPDGQRLISLAEKEEVLLGSTHVRDQGRPFQSTALHKRVCGPHIYTPQHAQLGRASSCSARQPVTQLQSENGLQQEGVCSMWCRTCNSLSGQSAGSVGPQASTCRATEIRTGPIKQSLLHSHREPHAWHS